jgi:hypothetical protein
MGEVDSTAWKGSMPWEEEVVAELAVGPRSLVSPPKSLPDLMVVAACSRWENGRWSIPLIEAESFPG